MKRTMTKNELILIIIIWVSAVGLVSTAGFFPTVIDNFISGNQTRSAWSITDAVNFYGLTFLAMFILMELLYRPYYHWHKHKKLNKKIRHEN